MSRVGMAAEYLRRVFGGEFEEEEVNIATSAVIAQVVGSEPDSVSLTMINLGANTIFVRIGNQPSANNGIQLNANGGFLSLDLIDDLTLVAREWFCVSPSGASVLYALRVRRYRNVEVPTLPPGTLMPLQPREGVE